jgi:hypothetical protein
MVRAIALGSSLAVVLACSKAATDDDGDIGEYPGGAGGAGGSLLTGGGGSGNSSVGGCSAAAELVYVLTDANELYSFAPAEKTFTKVGDLGCATDMQPNSMAIDRDAVAWVNYVDSNGLADLAGAIFKVSTVDASCEPAPAVTLPAGWYRIGMGFSTDGQNTEDETLFVASIDQGAGLGYVDREALSLVPVAPFTGPHASQNAELTGTGDGRLFAFFTSTPVEVAEIDKTTAAVGDPFVLDAVEVPLAWAFSFWGGDFYLYTATTGSSRVNHFRPSTLALDTSYVPNTGMRIVGAGVSTCAPLAPPE